MMLVQLKYVSTGWYVELNTFLPHLSLYLFFWQNAHFYFHKMLEHVLCSCPHIQGSTIDTFTQTAINSYIISYKAVGDSTVSSVIVMDGEATSQLLLGLMKGTIYEVTMVAGNSAGKSLPSEPLNKRTAVDCESCD